VSNDNKNYKSNIPKVKYVLSELEEGALREIGKFIVREARQRIESKSFRLSKAIAYYLRRKEKSVRIGVRGHGKRSAFYASWVEKGHKIMLKNQYFNEKSGKAVQTFRDKKTGGILKRKSVSFEFGGRMVPPHPFLTPAAEENIAQIRIIAGKYFKEIEKENIEKGYVDKKDSDEASEAAE
jgi:hypothetical protein